MVTDVGGRKKRNQFHKLTQNCFSSTSRHKLYHPSSKAKETVADCCFERPKNNPYIQTTTTTTPPSIDIVEVEKPISPYPPFVPPCQFPREGSY